MKTILILTMIYGHPAITTAEFNSPESCEIAGKAYKNKIKETINPMIQYICVEK